MAKRNKCYCQPGLKILIGNKLIDRITLLQRAFEPYLSDIEFEDGSVRCFRSRVLRECQTVLKKFRRMREESSITVGPKSFDLKREKEES